SFLLGAIHLGELRLT
ncbi:hypothetical protein MJO29_011879, partial [Puccinia striiformis f. sp. tritici]